MKKITQTQLIIYVSIFFILFDNYSFFHNVLQVYPLNWHNIGFLISLAVILVFFMIFLLSLVCYKYTLKPIIITLLLVSSLTNYFMNSYHVVIDASMIRNTLQTNMHESLDLVTLKQVLYFVFLGLLPSYFVYKAKIAYRPFKQEFFARLKLIGLSLAVIVASFFLFSKFYTSFVREHKPLRYSINPAYWMYSIGKYINLTFNSGPLVVKPIGLDAKIVNDDNRKKLVIMVVGEAARADHFSLNGYKRETNPLLAQDDIVDFPNFYSCGTSTAASVPCMFAKYGKSDYSYKKGISTENVLDVLKHTKDVAILWRDNNSDSKGVALRVPYEDYKIPKNNTVCADGECRDVGMLVGLDKFIQKNKDKNILIVLHQMGNHGPAYYKRYPKAFEKFTPTCKTNQLEDCTQQEITNAYDNAILYTDYFLDKTINFLKKYENKYDTAMIYMSDHGESLGEGGVYLHGLPYFMAPDAQVHIGALMWFGKNMAKRVDEDALRKRKDEKYTQDDLFHTLLGIFDVHTKEYNKKLDILKDEH
ncbi:phosphoethanolamine--lipid A transferase [Sulfurimonas sp. NW7]|uniref:phosphoethanolamine transferase n=1 Tax=Sulfurimonas sp. NW7 TaxID=2922727 RepID=UPI003DA8939F